MGVMQVRIAGPVTQLPPEESDAYFHRYWAVSSLLSRLANVGLPKMLRACPAAAPEVHRLALMSAINPVCCQGGKRLRLGKQSSSRSAPVWHFRLGSTVPCQAAQTLLPMIQASQ